MPSYTITEPHPTVPQNTYVHAGRGGAGNHFRAPATTSPAGVPTALPAPAAPARRFYSGRGGAGNAHSHVERPVLSFEDEFSRADRRERDARLGAGYHVGRGGAGNFAAAVVDARGPPPPPGSKGRKGSVSSAASTSSSGSVGSAILRRLGGALRR